MDNSLQYTLEELIDKHGLSRVIDAIVETCNEKAEHVQTNYNDKVLASQWKRCARSFDKASAMAVGANL